MDLDSSMVPENDQDPASPQNQSATPMEKEAILQMKDQSPDETGSESAPLTPNTTIPPAPAAVGQPPVVGPRCAPTYSVVNAILEKKEDGPGPRCGHTLTAVPAVGEEGTPCYIGPRLILFGGATALEGNSGGTGTPTSAGSAGIRTFCFLFSFFSSIAFTSHAQAISL